MLLQSSCCPHAAWLLHSSTSGTENCKSLIGQDKKKKKNRLTRKNNNKKQTNNICLLSSSLSVQTDKLSVETKIFKTKLCIQ